MKALLMYPDRDFNLQPELPRQAQALTQDLELDTLLHAMAGDDAFLFNVARTALLSGLQNDIDTVLYRQEIVKDCLENAAVVRQLYDLAVEAIDRERKRYFSMFSHYPAAILHGAIELLHIFIDVLTKLRGVADAQAGRFESRGFTALFAMLQREFSDEYFARVQEHLTELKFRGGVLVSAGLGRGNAGTNYVLRQARNGRPGWFDRLLGKGPTGYVFRLADRDEAGARALSELRDRGINLAANALAQSGDHILSFFQMLRTELAFYVGCLNVHDALATKGVSMTFPRPEGAGTRRLRFSGLSDVCLALSMEHRVVSNTLDADGKSLVIVTGANQGGKSSFLRSIGLAQVMMHCGMFVAAESFAAELCTGLFTHYKREEDATMKSGKFDEEISRMSDVADSVGPNAMLLFNESFASTNEREGSEIARQVVCALLERGIKVFFVTHLYEFAHGLFDRKMENAVFVRAERRADGTRTFRVVEGEPLETSYGEDLYRKVFADEIPDPGCAEARQAARSPARACLPASKSA
jgi:hypothetical protein